ncbi:hypothetical protein G6F46_009493 [Rhizopus delemar]|uniref:Uncharacterized protein n=2 Tax=Rhizopus TaxID=4842 RepID=A0A9P6Z143_9FUNG|nr:hypothetical protein G6F55_008395 [Rhizopus delemar]KAG1551951.1 hypothetical protein G6F51_001519 [Rhizopus arrhizus]KAG1493554.1 hypothetical protein G6F54_008492 [Rhizopus delemar]KAG1506880.1 hypothetical protein G6F53_009364 [Rhizopus delemar]KAG1524910.1 hypothetical protein G6F52_003793 [Rhizopus delemar]
MIASENRLRINDQHPYFEEPCSPISSIFSTSWIAEKSTSELGDLLKSAYKSLREKERVLVAEIGQSLLEYNQNLKKDYDHLLQDTSNQKEEIHLISNKKTYETIIESLERKNEEIQSMLEESKEAFEQSELNHERNQRKLETEIEILQYSLEVASQKVHELEEHCLVCQKRANRKHEIELREQRKQDLIMLEEVWIKMEALDKENKLLQKSKRTVQEKLAVTLNDLNRLRTEFERLEMRQQDYRILQEAFEKQTDHVRELNDRLEEHRDVLSTFHDQPLTVSYASSQSLMYELDLSITSKSYSHTLHERHLASFHSADDALCPVLPDVRVRLHQEPIEDLFPKHTNHREYNLYPSYSPPPTQPLKASSSKPTPFLTQLFSHLRRLSLSFTRYCRFIFILVTAVLINLWKGPDLLLEKNHVL